MGGAITGGAITGGFVAGALFTGGGADMGSTSAKVSVIVIGTAGGTVSPRLVIGATGGAVGPRLKGVVPATGKGSKN